MANVTFRRGTEANLPSSGMADEGCFFLAEDTGNLYVGDENGNLVPINRSPYYGTCPTEASTNSKVVTIDVNSDVFSLSEGAMISVRFANANTAASPTLNVNGSGAIAVKSYGTTSIGDTEDSSWHAGEVVTFVYDGQYWMRVGDKIDLTPYENVQSDWEQDDAMADDYIKNKPTIPPDRIYIAGDNVSIEDAVPYGYTKLEYVYNSSNTYQSTGIRPTVDDVELEFEYRDSNAANYGCLFGNMPTSSTTSHYGLGYFGSADISLSTKGTNIFSGINKVNGNRFLIKGVLKNGNGSIYVKDLTNGTEGQGSGTYTFSETRYNIEIFRKRHNGTYMPSGARVYKAVIKIKGETVLNYIPAKRNSDNVCGFWDTVSKTFVTATDGQWNAGPVSEWEKHFTISAINIPTSTSELTNDSGFITDADIPVTDVTVGGTSVVSNGVAVVPAIPDSTSDLTNDSGFITSADVPSPANTAPLMDGTAAAGTSTDYAREDHVHPSDKSKQNVLVAGRDIDIQDIVEVEYMESTGTQYIDTGINTTETLSYDIVCAFLANGNNLMGAIYNPSGSTYHRCNFGVYSGFKIYYGSTSPNAWTPQSYDNSFHRFRQLISREDITVFFDDVEYNSFTRQTYNLNLNFWIFGRNANNNSLKIYCSCRIKSVKLQDEDNVVLADMVPVRVGTTGYMYDRVSGHLFGNDGTGYFVLGPDVRPLSLISFVNNDGFVTSDELATVATTGSYNDLNDTPTIQNFVGSDDTQSGTSGLVPAPSMSGSVKLLTSLRNNSWLPINSPYLDLCTKTYVDNMIGDIETLLAAI